MEFKFFIYEMRVGVKLSFFEFSTSLHTQGSKEIHGNVNTSYLWWYNNILPLFHNSTNSYSKDNVGYDTNKPLTN